MDYDTWKTTPDDWNEPDEDRKPMSEDEAAHWKAFNAGLTDEMW